MTKITYKRAAEIAGVTRQTIINWVGSGKLSDMSFRGKPRVGVLELLAHLQGRDDQSEVSSPEVSSEHVDTLRVSSTNMRDLVYLTINTSSGDDAVVLTHKSARRLAAALIDATNTKHLNG